MDWWYFPQFLVENVCIQKKEFRTAKSETLFLNLWVGKDGFEPPKA